MTWMRCATNWWQLLDSSAMYLSLDSRVGVVNQFSRRWAASISWRLSSSVSRPAEVTSSRAKP